ncbi:MAG: hypothetical protein ACYDGR_11450 [Candidatus Dormibacteria bacterium]
MKNPFLGRWRIRSMELWEPADVDLVGPATITIRRDGAGEFNFVAVEGWMDCRFGARDNRPLVEFSWEGTEDGDVSGGRGWATIESDGSLTGRIYFHLGDDSGFTAEADRSPK